MGKHTLETQEATYGTELAYCLAQQPLIQAEDLAEDIIATVLLR